MADVYLGIGSNMGDRQANIDRALQFLKEHEDIKLIAVSSFIETEPEGGPPQENFLNGALHIQTELLPLDLDILFYDDVVILDGKSLSIPHPRMEKRLFVLRPLAEIAPDLNHPRLKKTVRELLDLLSDESHTARSGA